MPRASLPLPADVACLPETMKKFREHAQVGNYALALRYHKQGRAAINSFVATSEVMMDGDRSRVIKWRGLAAELDAEVKLVEASFESVRLNVGFSVHNVRFCSDRLQAMFRLLSCTGRDTYRHTCKRLHSSVMDIKERLSMLPL